jgi:hypothetical protein
MSANQGAITQPCQTRTIDGIKGRERVSSAVKTGVLPGFTEYLGPRTALAGFCGDYLPDHQPVEQHADGSQMLLLSPCVHFVERRLQQFLRKEYRIYCIQIVECCILLAEEIHLQLRDCY